MDSSDLAQYIDERNIDAEIVHLEVKTPTVEEAAAAVGVPTDQIGKSILFLAEGSPLLVIACGTTRVGYKKLAQYLGISRKRLKLATAVQVLKYTGYQVGTVPPFAHRDPVRTLLESGVLRQPELYVGGGAINALLRIAAAELQRVTGAEIISL